MYLNSLSTLINLLILPLLSLNPEKPLSIIFSVSLLCPTGVSMYSWFSHDGVCFDSVIRLAALRYHLSLLFFFRLYDPKLIYHGYRRTNGPLPPCTYI
ncbi:hypothetical protein E2C01_051691 [Portunus trituberculatus]|uniref:Uncharacterized protein n=1 Tax=Portunus trituberculatus TaxID=210409 RepID=A0A5B7GMF9_PORTR|nr:hypothetical protein [Portunus trituberculatus]